MANAMLVRLLIAGMLLVPGWLLMAYLHSSGGGTPPPGSPGAQASELMANATLASAARELGAHRGAYGTFAGANLAAVPDARLIRADVATFCIETGKDPFVYHLDGAAQQDNSWNWGGVKGPCAAQ
jgi:hypothetical protein